MYQYSAKDVARLLAQNVDKAVAYLLPNGKRSGHEWCVGSIRGEPGESLKVCLSGEKTGVWSDFATKDAGDLLNLWAATRAVELKDAILEAKSWLGISTQEFLPQRRKEWARPILNQKRSPLNSAVSSYLMEERRLTKQTLDAYRITAEGNNIVFPSYRKNELILVKYLSLERPDGKKKIWASKDAEPCLFGWQAVSGDARQIALTEGEIDAMTLYQYGINMPVVSIPFGGGSGDTHAWIQNEFENLSIYDEIYICMDNDDTGQATALELIRRLGNHRCRIVKLPHKDANECLKNGVTCDEILNCFKMASVLDPDELKRWESYVEQIVNPTSLPQGYLLPWKKTDGKIALGPAELSVWTGINGHGKSQILGHVLLDCMKQGARVCVASFEIKPLKLLERLMRQASGDRKPTEEYVRAIFEWYGDNGWIFELVGTAKTDRILEVFKYARMRYGVDVFVIDSFMKCGIAEDDYNAQKAFLEQLCDFKNEFNCHVHLVVHPRKVADESKIPGKLDVKGSGVITDLADNCFTVWRDKKKEEKVNKLNARGIQIPIDVAEECDCILRCDKQRNGEWEGVVRLWFDRDSFQYLESHKSKPRHMVDYQKPSGL